MGKIFYLMGKSASGKDKIYQMLLEMPELALSSLVLYTTRPIREHETDGVEYHFVTHERLAEMQAAGKVIERREYHTVQGLWIYFTADDENLNLESGNYLAIGTLVSYGKLREHYGADKIVPLYIEVADDVRLERAMRREKKQARPDYEEMCRRFLADAADFSEENIRKAGIRRRFQNNGELGECIQELAEYIAECEKI